MEELRSRLESEKKSRQDLEKELELQVDKNSCLFATTLFPYIRVNGIYYLFFFFLHTRYMDLRKYIETHKRIDQYFCFFPFLHTD